MAHRVTFLVDGFNVYHSIRQLIEDGNGRGQTVNAKWLNLRAMCQALLVDVNSFQRGSTIAKIRYFTALATHLHPDVINRHKTYIKALESENVLVAAGNFKRKRVKCPKCKDHFESHEEKETDVNIAIALIRCLMDDECDTCVIISGDTDLVSAVVSAKQLFPHKKVAIGFPFRRHNNHFQSVADFTFKLKLGSYVNAQFQPLITCADGTHVNRPLNW